MYSFLKIYTIIFLLLFSCKNEGQDLKNKNLLIASKTEITNQNGGTIKTRFNPPNSYSRITQNANSFAYYLQNFPLKPANAKVHLYNGKLKYRQDVHSAVLDIDVGNRDLQQCADAIMRLRAEFLFKEKQYDKISFNLTNGFKANYSKWRKDYRINVKGNHTTWVKTTSPSDSYRSFRKYLVMIFSYAGTLSLENELLPVEIAELQISDIFIQGGSPGHAIIVVDMAVNNKGEKVFLLAQSYMPAQEIHILKNLNNNNVSPWYNATNLQNLITPEWTFTKDNLKRFE